MNCIIWIFMMRIQNLLIMKCLWMIYIGFKRIVTL